MSESETPEVRPVIDRERELRAHEYRTGKRERYAPIRAVFQVIRNDERLWNDVEAIIQRQPEFEVNTAEPGETHRISAGLFAGIYSVPEAAALYDIALYDATQRESAFLKERIKKGINYAPITINGGGGIYGTILAASLLKENPDVPVFGADVARRRGGVWATSGDVTLNKEWWLMNSRNRPENKKVPPLPGSEGNLNSLGAEVQNLQLPDISSRQYAAQNEFARVIAHDNYHSLNLITEAKLVKVRINKDPQQVGSFQNEYEDPVTGERFYTYTDVPVQATGLGTEKFGFSPMFSSTKEVLEEAARDLKDGVRTPRVLTFLQLVEATTSNRTDAARKDFKRFGLVGIGDTSRIIREYFIGAGVNGKVGTQLDFVEEVTVFGLTQKNRDELIKNERARYVSGFLEFQRPDGGFFRFKPVEGRVVGVGKAKDEENVVVYYERIDETPEGPVRTIGKEVVPRLVTSAGFQDESDMIYSGVTAEVIDDRSQIAQRIDEIKLKAGSTLYYGPTSKVFSDFKIARVDIDGTFLDNKFIEVTIIDVDNKARKVQLDRTFASVLFDPQFIEKAEIAGAPLKFEPYFDPEYDMEIPVAEKAEGYEIYKVGACTKLPITDKEKRQTKAYEKVPQNSKSVFRFVRRTVAFGQKLARRFSKQEQPALNTEQYRSIPQELSEVGTSENKADVDVIPVDARAAVQKLPNVLTSNNLLRYLAVSRLECVFEEGLDNIKIGVKRIDDPNGDAPYNFAVEFSPPLPNNSSWDIFPQFLNDILVQRLLVRETGKSSQSAEITIGIKRGRIDIRSTKIRSIKNNEKEQFSSSYTKLAEK